MEKDNKKNNNLKKEWEEGLPTAIRNAQELMKSKDEKTRLRAVDIYSRLGERIKDDGKKDQTIDPGVLKALGQFCMGEEDDVVDEDFIDAESGNE